MIRRAIAHLMHILMPAEMEAEINHCRSKRSAMTKRAQRSAEVSRHVAKLRAEIAARQEVQDVEDDGFLTLWPAIGDATPRKG